MPSLAMEAHKAAITRVVDSALAQAGIDASQLDAVAVTVGPGLSLCLRVRASGAAGRMCHATLCFHARGLHCRLPSTHARTHTHTRTHTHARTQVGVLKAMALAAQHQLPLVRVHHMEAHALVVRLVTEAQGAQQQAAQRLLPSSAQPGSSSSSSDSLGDRVWAGAGEAGPAAAGTSPSASPAEAAPPATAAAAAAAALRSAQGTAGGRGLPGEALPFPFLCLLVSGGHNLVVLVQGVGQYMQLGTTVDDALGVSPPSWLASAFLPAHTMALCSAGQPQAEAPLCTLSDKLLPCTRLIASSLAFMQNLCCRTRCLGADACRLVICLAGEAYDKVARLLGLDLVPCGGAALECLAREGDPRSFK